MPTPNRFQRLENATRGEIVDLHDRASAHTNWRLTKQDHHERYDDQNRGVDTLGFDSKRCSVRRGEVGAGDDLYEFV